MGTPLLLGTGSFTPAAACSDADGQAFITATGTTDATQQTAICELCKNLKNANIWTKFNAIYPFIGSTATTHKYNLKNPLDTNAAFRLSFQGGWTHSSNGAVGNSVNTHANTFFNPSTQSTLNNTHLSIYSRTTSAGVTWQDIGNTIPPSQFAITSAYSNVAYSDSYNYNTGRISIANTDAKGFYLQSRTSASVHKFFKNGNQFGTTNTGASGSFVNLNIFLGALNDNGNAQYRSSREYAFASIGSGLTDLEAQVFNQIVEGYQFALGRNINPSQSFYYNRNYNVETNAFLYSTQITDATTQGAVNTLVNDLQGYGIWTKMKAIYPMVGSTATTQKFNLVNSQDTNAAYRIVFVGGWTHSSTGAAPNGSNAYASTCLSPSVAFAVDHNKHMSYYSRTNAATAAPASTFGSDNSTSGYCRMTIRGLSNQLAHVYGGTNGTFASTETDSRGFYLANRSSSTTSEMYKNGSLVGNGNSANSTTSNIPQALYIGAALSGGTVAYYDNKECAFASIGDSLTATEVANFRTAVQAFQTTLGRQV